MFTLTTKSGYLMQVLGSASNTQVAPSLPLTKRQVGTGLLTLEREAGVDIGPMIGVRPVKRGL